DGADRLALRLHGEHQAGAHGFLVEDHGAGAADAVLAADMGAGLAAVVADGIDQGAARLDPDSVVAAPDVAGDVGLLGDQNPFGRSLPNFALMRASSSLLERASIGNVSRRDHGRQASMTMRALRGSSWL